MTQLAALSIKPKNSDSPQEPLHEKILSERAMLKTHYTVLGIRPCSQHSLIKETYRQLARKKHPDMIRNREGREPTDEELNLFESITAAGQTLLNIVERACYDRVLEMRCDRCERCGGTGETVSGFGAGFLVKQCPKCNGVGFLERSKL
jgi:DnaJ-class molecular chaperone